MTRAQSTTVATVFLVLTVFVIGGSIYVVGSNTLDSATRESPRAALDLETESSVLSFRHRSGDSITLDETTAVLTGTDGTTQRIPLPSNTKSDDDGQMTAGESVELSYTPTTPSFTIRLVHEPSGSTLGTWERTVTIPSLDLSDNGGDVTRSNVNSGSNGGTVTFSNGGRTVVINGDQWAQSSKSYTVGTETTLSVTFDSSSVCEIHAIGFADTQNEGRMVRLAGSQNWGTNVTEFGEPYYQQGDGKVRYNIPIGSHYESKGILRGSRPELTAKLTLTNDCDDGPPSGSPVQSDYSQIYIDN